MYGVSGQAELELTVLLDAVVDEEEDVPDECTLVMLFVSLALFCLVLYLRTWFRLVCRIWWVVWWDSVWSWIGSWIDLKETLGMGGKCRRMIPHLCHHTRSIPR